MEHDREGIEDRRVDALFLQRRGYLRRVVPAQHRLESNVGELRALTGRVEKLVDARRRESDTYVDLVFGGRCGIIYALELQPDRVEKCVQAGRNGP